MEQLFSLEYMVSILLSGISLGGQLALIAIGYTMVYGILRLINFAHGDVFMAAGLIMVYLSASLPIGVALPLMILLTVLLPWWMEGRLLLLRRVLGAASAVGLIVAGRCRRAGKCPLFLTHLAVCAFFVVHMLGNYGIWCSNPQLQDYWLDLSASAMMALFAFYEAAFDAGMGRRRMQLATGLMAAYLGCAALSGSGYLILYFGCAVWALTDLCSLTPKPKQENAA